MSGKSPLTAQLDEPVKVGILHSLSGTMAISEPSLKDAALMAIAEINQAGGVLGKRILPVIEDGASYPTVFATQAKKLIEQDRVATIFGCWTSASRKAVLPILEQFNTLLWYPCQYEGLESSKHIFYMGSCANQQIEPAVNWLLQNQAQRFYLLGSDYVFPRTANKMIKAQLKLQGGICVAENYVSLGEQNFHNNIALIKKTKPDVVFSTLNGDSNLAFYQQYQQAGITAAQIPIMAVSVAEEELRRLQGNAATGHYAVCSYFQSLTLPRNQVFVENFKAQYGASRVTSDPIEAAYFQVYLWKNAVEKAGSFATDQVRSAAYGLSFDAPGGGVCITKNHHLWKHFRIGKVLPDGQFEVVYEFPEPIKPLPWLGVEELKTPTSSLIMDLLGELADGIQDNCQLEANSRSQDELMAELVAYNRQLRATQQQLLASQAREKLLKRRLASQIRHSLDLETVVRIAVEEIRNLLNVDRCQFIWCYQSKDYISYKLAFRATQSKMATSSCIIDNIEVVKILGAKIIQADYLCLANVAQDSQLEANVRQQLQNLNLKALWAAPVHTRSGQVGIITCEQCHQPRKWAEHEIELLESVVDQLAIAIEQAQLYKKSQIAAAAAQAQAQKLQQTLEELQQTQAQLIQTEKMSTLGQLVAGIAHEMNNPASFICGNLNYAKEYTNDLLKLLSLYQKHYPQPDPEIKHCAQAVELDFLQSDLPKIIRSMEVGSNRIHHLVMSLRNYSRRDCTHMQAVDLHEGIESTLLILNNRLKPHGSFPGIEIIRDYGNLPPVECYPAEISQVFTNILGNAVDAIEELSVRNRENHSNIPRICIHTEAAGEETVRIKIVDNGPGIEPGVIKQLFEPFFTTKPIGKGTGLGLSISHQIVVEKHKGKLECFSQPEEGTTFLIELPVNHSAKLGKKITGVFPVAQSSV